MSRTPIGPDDPELGHLAPGGGTVVTGDDRMRVHVHHGDDEAMQVVEVRQALAVLQRAADSLAAADRPAA